ncbi:hypothetical protein GGX14DRAFT_359992 [Mycena pura]|uniref:CxC1-like cysteine cluster associated with KDZ transposases domain-containing protein n=1 Tax=Mycena pura TaxID=153505 RepID=A0AAD6VNB6_9AGAR|nr:hypothetical protein GGX14DRAFT_359992 [Mycena pura]
MIQGDAFVSSAFTRQGVMPVSPYSPTVAITIRVLEFFRAAHLRCPRLGIQAFVRTLCDLHGIAPRPYLVYQFTVAFDLYLALRAIVDKRVQAELGRDVANWRLKNSCPACLYKLEGEPELHIPVLATMDGNNSLKRFARRERETISDDETTAPGASKERCDDRVPPGDYYLPREEVDIWAQEGLEELMKGFVADPEWEEESDGCTERWQNMKEDVTARAWGLYDETGIFISLCRHGFVLVVADMVQSGELAKYGFAVTAHLIRVLRELGLGYDIGCKFGKMVKAHPLLSQLAKENRFTSLVGAFHGHAHNRICQTRFLTTYVKGVGLEDLEGCESFFSKSNALAASTRYATVFHRQQAISTYLEHMDNFDTYQGLSSLLSSKYRRALKIKSTLPALQETMESLGVVNRETFESWLARERECLEQLLKEPLVETLQMEYYQKLVNLRDHEYHLQAVMGVDMPMMPVGGDDGYSTAVRQTSRIESQRWHAQEVHAKTLAAVQDLELRIGVSARWIPGDADWEAASKMVSERRYRRALDHLERLVISRMFELTKVNMAGTGTSLILSTGCALTSRSKAVKTAILKYNEAAESCTPARPTLTWVEVVEYAFLADFDLLRLGREDVRKELWATPGGRAAMDQHFKILRAEEEIFRLDLEIPRFVTYMTDEDSFMVYHEGRLQQEGKVELAYQVRLLRMKRGRFNSIHMERLVKLSEVPGFSGSITPGNAVSKERRVPAEAPRVAEAMPIPMPMPIDEIWCTEEDGDEEIDDEDEEISGVSVAFEHILRITHDSSDVPAL